MKRLDYYIGLALTIFTLGWFVYILHYASVSELSTLELKVQSLEKTIATQPCDTTIININLTTK